MSTCIYCGTARSADEVCFHDPGYGYVCTREPGHDGPHVACGMDHQIDTWEDPR